MYQLTARTYAGPPLFQAGITGRSHEGIAAFDRRRSKPPTITTTAYDQSTG
jgi:hypothetical protein